MSKTMKNTVSVTILAEKLVKGDVVRFENEWGANLKVTYTAVRRDGTFEVGFGERGETCYDYGDKVEILRPLKSLSKAQLTKALKAVQKQQNSLACQAGDLQDALVEIERTAKPAKNTY